VTPFIVGPGKGTTFRETFITTAAALPLYETVVGIAVGGTPLVFDSANQTRELDVPIPRLAGLDDIELDRLAFDVRSGYQEDDSSTGGQPSNGTVTVSLNSAQGATVRLQRIEINDLTVTASEGNTFGFQGSGSAGTLSRVLYDWNVEEGKTVVVPNGSGGTKQLHILVRPVSGPPAAAAPHFAMPGAGSNMYGPALGGASVSLTNVGGKIRAVLELNPALDGNRFSVMVGHADKSSPTDGLPNEMQAAPWSAATVAGFFDVRPASVSIKASAAAAGPDTPVVAEFPTDPGDSPIDVDFAGVARSLLKKAYPTSQGDDLGLKLLFTAGSAGELRVRLGNAAARYISRPLGDTPVSRSMLGAPESIELPVSDTFRPAALSFTIDGIYGPARLTVDSDTSTPETRHGFRVQGSVQVARLVALTAVEANLPLIRLGLFGRASEPSEILLSLHRGDDIRIGPAVAEPLSLEIDPSDVPDWHRKEYAAPGPLPPHAPMLWLVVRATRGTFWWYGPLDVSGSTQRSDDEGATFSQIPGRPILHVSVTEVDSETGNPTPVFPVALRWRDGLLNADLVGVAGQEASLPPDFRRFWIAEGAAQSAFFNSVPALQGLLRLTFACQRDVELTMSNAVLTFDPWDA
jgi:hypothetical protein